MHAVRVAGGASTLAMRLYVLRFVPVVSFVVAVVCVNEFAYVQNRVYPPASPRTPFCKRSLHDDSTFVRVFSNASGIASGGFTRYIYITRTHTSL